MNALIAVTLAIFVATITPGPNNLIVLRVATRSGIAAAVPAIVGIVMGGIALLVVIGVGGGAVFAAEPRLRTLLVVGGSGYLAWLGIRLLRSSTVRTQAAHRDDVRSPLDKTLATGVVALFGFQFLNPKAWVMIATATAATPSIAIWQRAALFSLVSTLCLALWSVLGSLLACLLTRPALARWFDRAMGASLIVSAVLLAAEG